MKKSLLCLFLLLTIQSNATHIVGGELNYKHLGGWNYEIRLTVYRDCWVGVPPFDNPASLGVFDINNNIIANYFLPYSGLDTLEPTINDPCTIAPTDFCYEVTTYVDTLNLPPIPGGYQLAYQRCCRNQQIINIFTPQATGATYYATIPDTAVVINNSNPVFKNWPPPFICADKLLSFDHSATDPDGDSLVYELFTPYQGASAAIPQPIPPNAPPYLTVVFSPPYSTNNMLGGPQAMRIDAQTGLLTAIPNTLGYFVIGIKCKEYRNGILIGETKRDFQFIVKACPKIVVAAGSAPNVQCGSKTVSFSNTSAKASQYSWYFGDPTVTSDSSNLETPSYTYSSTGTYTTTLIAYSTAKPECKDATTISFSITDQLSGSFDFRAATCEENKLLFFGTVETLPGLQAKYLWYFGDTYSISGLDGEAIPLSPINNSNNFGTTTNTYNNPIHTYPTGENEYPVTLIAFVPGSATCIDTIAEKSVQISAVKNLFIPNSFTPNNDGNNDIFIVRGNTFSEFYFAVYDRWGNLVFETTDESIGWDGSFEGRKSDPAVYAWYLRVKCEDENNEVIKKGNVTLIR